MTTHTEYPKLRWPIEISLERIDAQELIMIRDPLGLREEPLFLTAAVAPILAQLEGTQTVAEIVQRFQPLGLDSAVMQELLRILDDAYFLATPRFFAATEQMKREFLGAEVRAPALAGRGYARDPSELTQSIQGHLRSAKRTKLESQKLMALVAPHIDYYRGAECYAETYAAIEAQRSDVDIVIGTGHQYSEGLFHLTRKHFAIPGAHFECDRAFVDELATQWGSLRSFADEFLHKKEHSLELQLPFLAETARNGTVLTPTQKVVPILVGSFQRYLQIGKYPETDEVYDSFVAVLKETIEKRERNGQTIRLICGVDMAHVGRSFGDTDTLSPEKMERIRARDQVYLDAILSGNKKALFDHIAEDNDARRMCGFPTMYTVLDLLERLGRSFRATLFDYRQAVDYTRECAVTFAGIGLYEQPLPPRVTS
jgi:AmmeMemoRadiSam system protein B